MRVNKLGNSGLFHIAIAMCFLSSCTNNSFTGNSSETTNVAMTSSNKPAGYAKVKLIDAENWVNLIANHQSPVLDSTVANKNGEFAFKNIPEIVCNLQIDHDSSGVLIRGFYQNGRQVFSDTTIQLDDYAVLEGSCSYTDERVAKVLLEGTSYNTGVNQNQEFVFPKVAPGDFSLFMESSSGVLSITGKMNLASGQSASTGGLTTLFSKVYVDNFEDGNYISIPGLLTGGEWFEFMDTSAGGNSEVTTDIKTDEMLSKVLFADITLQLRTLPGGAWAGVGVSIGNIKDDWDFSKVKAISFRAKGKGTMRMSVESPVVDSINEWPHFGAFFTLDSTWNTYTFSVDSLKLVSPSPAASLGLKWQDVSGAISRIEFEASESYSGTGSLQIWIDDLTIDGISATDLIFQMK